jgi:hypothetical protein
MSTVRDDRNTSWAISRLVRPTATRRRTSRSRRESRPQPHPLQHERRRARRRTRRAARAPSPPPRPGARRACGPCGRALRTRSRATSRSPAAASTTPARSPQRSSARGPTSRSMRRRASTQPSNFDTMPVASSERSRVAEVVMQPIEPLARAVGRPTSGEFRSVVSGHHVSLGYARWAGSGDRNDDGAAGAQAFAHRDFPPAVRRPRLPPRDQLDGVFKCASRVAVWLSRRTPLLLIDEEKSRVAHTRSEE